MSWPSLDQGRNPSTAYIPVARIADMLLNPGETIDYNGAARDLSRHPPGLLGRRQPVPPPPGPQPAGRGLAPARDGHRATSPGGTPLARVTPTSSCRRPRRWSATTSAAPRASGHLFAMHRAIDPVGEARNDYDIFAGLAGRLGFENAFTEGRDEMGWLRHLYDRAPPAAAERGVEMPDFDRFWARRRLRACRRRTGPHVMFEAFRADPDTRAAQDAVRAASRSSRRPSPGFGYDDCPGHPVWLEPAEWLGADRPRYPLHLISSQPDIRLHSQLDNGRVSRADKVQGREAVWLQPDRRGSARHRRRRRRAALQRPRRLSRRRGGDRRDPARRRAPADRGLVRSRSSPADSAPCAVTATPTC